MTGDTTENVTRKRWKQALDHTEQALSFAPTEREQFINTACANDPELRKTVGKMIEAHNRAEAEGFMEMPVISYSPLDADHAAMIGKMVGDYRITRFIGDGGMGLVFEAERADDRFRKRVAIKLMRNTLDDVEMAFFKAEVQSLADLEHQNVARLIDSKELPDGRRYLVMEYVAGRNLHELIREKGALSFDKIITITGQICAGLNAAHRKGIIHRDIKPANILVAEESGELLVKVLDFGIALRTKTLNVDPVLQNQLRGTLPYISPEQCKGAGRDDLTPASDIYSLGLVVYEMLLGRRAIRGESPTEIIAQHLAGSPQPPSRFRTDIPPEVNRVVMKALAKDPKDRYQTAPEFAATLEAALRGEKLPNKKSSYAKWAVAIAAAGIIITATSYFVRQPEPAKTEPPQTAASPSPVSSSQPRMLKLLLTVENTKGEPLSGSSFALFNEGITTVPARIGKDNAIILGTDRQGRAATEQAVVKLGTYLMKAVRVGYKSFIGNVTLSEDRTRPGTVTLVVTLEPE